jgi:predicted lipoprotein with Yx(FWY)xxD motif
MRPGDTIEAPNVVAVAVLLLVAVLAVAGCGGGSEASPAHKEPAFKPPTVDVSTNVKLGELLVDSKGRTLYLFKHDTGSTSTCFSSCAKAWPPLRTKVKPTVSGDAKAKLIATSARPDGPNQVTYNGHPLYLYQGDETPGKVNGQKLNSWGGRWFTVSPAGKQIVKGSKPKGGGGGY